MSKHLTTWLGILLFLTATTSQANSSCLRANKSDLLAKSSPYQKTIHSNARQYGVDANLIRSVIAIESCYNRKAVSPKGAQGLMQLIPDTAQRFGVSNSFSAQQNIRGGTRYLRFLLDRYQGDLRKALAAYNAGEGKVDHYQGIPPYRETRQYVKNVIATWRKLSPTVTLASQPRGKPGREGLKALKLRAPHLFKR